MPLEPERALQYWDDLDDLVGAIALRGERIRQLVLFSATTLLFLSLVLAGIGVAMSEPPLALAIVVLLFVTLMYRTVTNG